MISHEEYIKALDTIKQYHKQLKKIESEINNLSPFATAKKEDTMYETNVSSRLKNIFYWNYPIYRDEPIGNFLPKISKKEFLERRNAGKSTLAELDELCKWIGIKMLP